MLPGDVPDKSIVAVFEPGPLKLIVSTPPLQSWTNT